MTDERRIVRVRAAGWLSMTDLAYHCGVSPEKMRQWSMLSDFPQPSAPTGSWKEARYSKDEVDEWLRNHRRAA